RTSCPVPEASRCDRGEADGERRRADRRRWTGSAGAAVRRGAGGGGAGESPPAGLPRAAGRGRRRRTPRRRGVASGRSAGHRAGIARGEPVTTTAGPRGVPSPVRGRVVVAGSSRPWARQLVVAATSRTQDEPSGRKPTPRR